MVHGVNLCLVRYILYKYVEDTEKAMDDISDQLITYEDFEN